MEIAAFCGCQLHVYMRVCHICCSEQSTYTTCMCRYMRDGRKRPARLPYSFCKWIPIVYRYTEQEVIDLAGMDAAMYLRVLMFGAYYTFQPHLQQPSGVFPILCQSCRRRRYLCRSRAFFLPDCVVPCGGVANKFIGKYHRFVYHTLNSRSNKGCLT